MRLEESNMKVLERFSVVRAERRIFGVRKPCLRFDSPKLGFGLLAGAARLRPPKAGAWLPHSKPELRYTQVQTVLKHEQGTVLLYVAGSLIVMMLFVGLAIDGGWTTYVRNQGQAAVDAAALSAASAITDYKKGTATSTTIERRASAFSQNAASARSANIV